MLLQPNSPETYALALSLKNAFSTGLETDSGQIALMTLERYADSVLNSLSVDNQIFPKPISAINELSNTQLWTLICFGVRAMLDQYHGQFTFTLASVIETCKVLHPDVDFVRENYDFVDLTNMIIQTELDLSFAFSGLESILIMKAQANQIQSIQTEEV